MRECAHTAESSLAWLLPIFTIYAHALSITSSAVSASRREREREKWGGAAGVSVYTCTWRFLQTGPGQFCSNLGPERISAPLKMHCFDVLVSAATVAFVLSNGAWAFPSSRHHHKSGESFFIVRLNFGKFCAFSLRRICLNSTQSNSTMKQMACKAR